MSESEPKLNHLGQKIEYIVRLPILNVTVLRPAPGVTKGETWNWNVGGVNLEEGDKVLFVGTASEAKVLGDTSPDNLIFKPSREIKKREELSKKDLLAVNPVMVDRFERKGEKPNLKATIVTQGPGGEPEEVDRALQTIDKVNQIKGDYESLEREKLEEEYRRIYFDDDLAMKYKDNLSAILGVLVSKYHIGSEELKKLRE